VAGAAARTSPMPADPAAAPEAPPTCGRAIAAALRDHGTTTVFAVTGGHVVPMLDGCAREGLRVITFRDERSAAFAAAAFGALTRQPGVCLVTAGPGLTNAVTGLAQAHYGNWPVLSLAGHYEIGLAELGALQELPQAELLRPVAKWTTTLHDPRRAREYVRRAWAAALAAPGGHAHLSVPMDIVTQPSPHGEADETCAAYENPPAQPSGGLPDDAVRRIVELLGSARTPLLLAGPGVWRSDGGQALRAFMEASGVPALTHEEARGLVPDSHPLCMGSLVFQLNPATRNVAKADLILAVGMELDWRAAYLRPPFTCPQATIVQIGSDPNARLPQAGRYWRIVADERAALEALAAVAAPPQQAWRPWTDRLAADQALAWSYREEETGTAPQAATGIHPYRIADAVEQARARHDANVVFDGGNIGKWGKFAVRAERPGQWNRLKGGFGAIGHGLVSAMVRRLTDPMRPCILLTGDGAFGYNAMEVEACVREGLPVIAVVAVDGAWGSVQTGLATRYAGTPLSTFTDLPATRYDKLARDLGAEGRWIDDPAELEPALDAAVASGRPTVLAVRAATVRSPAVYATSGY